MSRTSFPTAFAALAGAVLWLGTGLDAQAQVTRCTDPVSGKVTYTDGACASGAAATEIERRKTDEELAQERARTEDALRAKAERREQDLEQRRVEAQERAAQASGPQGKRVGRTDADRPAPAPATTVVDDYWGRYPYGHPRPPVRPQPAPHPPAAAITRCNVFHCTDAQGYSHPRGQIGETVPQPVTPAPPRHPRACRSQGGGAAC